MKPHSGAQEWKPATARVAEIFASAGVLISSHYHNCFHRVFEEHRLGLASISDA
jgi:hypothetical protein